MSLISNLFGHSSRPQEPPPGHNLGQQAQVLTFRPSPLDSNATLVERANHDYTTTPLFSISSAKKSKEIEVYRIGAGNQPLHQPVLVGSSKYSSLSSSTNVTLAGQHSMKLSGSSAGDGYKFTLPLALLGGSKMKWKSKMSGALVLQDENKQDLAKYDSSAGFKGASAAKFEILVPVDDYLLDTIVVTGMAAVKMLEKDKQVLEVLTEVLTGTA